MIANVASADVDNWIDYGDYRITHYCQYCNEEVGRETASGARLEEGHVAMNGVPFGTIIKVGGREYEVVDRVSRNDTVDIFVEAEQGYCTCNKLEWQKVEVKE